MSDDDPFAEPDDTEKTVIRPNPGGRRPVAPLAPPVAAATPAPQDPPVQARQAEVQDYGLPQGAGPVSTAPRQQETPVSQAMTGMNRLNACGSTLFALVSRIRNRAQHRDAEALRRSVVGEVRNFESRALQIGIDPQQVKMARYAICATLDDVVLNTPWGGQSIWALQSLVATFHRETVGGDRFYDLLAKLQQQPGQNVDVLEFMFMCMSLGFEGRLRIAENGRDKHQQIRSNLAEVIQAQRSEIEHDLSPHWHGVKKAHKARSAWRPLLIAFGALAALLGVGYTSLLYALSGQTERVVGQLSVLEPVGRPELLRRAPPPPPPPPPPVEQINKVKAFLEEEVAEGLVTIFQNGNTITIRLTGNGMFSSASDSLQDKFLPAVNRVAEALNDEPGPIIVVGHSDNIPINTARFPNNRALSLARAKSVMQTMAGKLTDPSRVSAEGLADNAPIAANDTPEGRAKNRRIEIAIVRTDAQ
ncbi:type VI secretion system protein TssL [Algicella marina]|uniref:Type VI secretion system protein TssL n=2 Tax=Algicella marina TaxID=2683284 RepID=A0A6P1T6L6_9RHOB|nr:type VI secretion system protein TssL, long form [Algicella marina]QHQ37461.1 type VI secretion system protein TssL [Algicella marina]